MELSTNLREAFLVFLLLTVISLFNVGLLWEEQRISLRYMNLELTQMLELNQSQMERIRSIQAVYEIEVLKTTGDSAGAKEEKIDRLTNERNRRIMEVLNEQQKNKLHTYCTDLVSFAKMFE